MIRKGRERRIERRVTGARAAAILLQPLQDAFRQRLRLLDLLRLIARAAHADPDVAVAFQHEECAADSRPGPEGFLAETVDFLRLCSFFIALFRLFFAMEHVLPALRRIAARKPSGPGRESAAHSSC